MLTGDGRSILIISIHALLAESDCCFIVFLHFATLISIHALLAESDTDREHSNTEHKRFLSTLSLRRATNNANWSWPEYFNHFYPRSPCGERPSALIHTTCDNIISIHALLAESDAPAPGARESGIIFLSTLSLRRATLGSVEVGLPISRFLSTLSLRRATHKTAELIINVRFLSTLSLRRATHPW